MRRVALKPFPKRIDINSHYGRRTCSTPAGCIGAVAGEARVGCEKLLTLLGVTLTICLLSLAGFPGTGGFMGKIYLLQGAADSELWILSVILVLTTVASYWYYLRVAWVMWMKPPESENQHGLVIVPLPMQLALVATVGLILYTGVFPGAALDFARASVEGLGTLGGVIPGLAP